MTHQRSFRFVAARTFTLVITLSTGVLANAQGTASQPALDSGRPEIDAQSESQKPADAGAIHEGAGPIDCETLLAQEDSTRNSQSGEISRTDGTSQPDGESASSPYRENQPNQDTQISTLEECRAQQIAAPEQQPSDAETE